MRTWISELVVAAVVVTGAAAVACTGGDGSSSETSRFPATEEGARELLGEFLKPGADLAALSKQLRPGPDDYRAVYDAETGDKLAATYDPLWDRGEVVFKPGPGHTELKIWGATGEDLRNGTGNADQFPGGYKKIADKLQPGFLLYRFKFVKPGEDIGNAFDGLVHVNGRWVVIPKPWKALGAG